ncbi:ufm1-specific protease 2-like [Uloborus diversus]|uniref:ufm1-specific protease 2-like n=1 Tax=Uloborus diversus TaxID=327109 RepID=UPI00240A1D9E|nr:ufm1-specific protease 2-like [Uloborus diversus]
MTVVGGAVKRNKISFLYLCHRIIYENYSKTNQNHLYLFYREGENSLSHKFAGVILSAICGFFHMEHEKKTYVPDKFRKTLIDAKVEAGYVAGLETEEGKYCLSAAASSNLFLPGLKVLGIFCKIGKDNSDESELLNICNQYIDKFQVELENVLAFFIRPEPVETDLDAISVKLFSTYHHFFAPVEVLPVDYIPIVLLRAQGKLPLLFEVSSDSETLKENAELAMERLRNVAHSEVAAFVSCNSGRILTSCQDKDGDISGLFEDGNPTEKTKKRKKNKEKVPINFRILIQTSGDVALQNTVNHSLVIHCQRRDFRCVSMSLPLDVLAVCPELVSTRDIHGLLNDAIRWQLEKMNECLMSYLKISEFVCPVPHHFYPDIWDVPMTIIYPSNKTDADLENTRKSLHQQLLLPLNRPFVRKLNTYDFSDMSGYLVNPHEGLPPSGVQGGHVSIVQGRYVYHHYMQDHMNDDGWGCAYRSLQTILSWFRIQGYTDRKVPTHAEIQQALVDMGDKTPKFVGSRQWIGSQEVGFCLDHLAKVQSKIMCVNTGAEMANRGRELFVHFRDQGTPVMIGGGVLAHTILGVHFNEHTGDLKFLILDPHYTGGEDIHIIQSKGWCGWKSVNFWDQNAFYNLCLPQRPELI